MRLIFLYFFSFSFFVIEFVSACDNFIGFKPNGIDAGLHQHLSSEWSQKENSIKIDVDIL